MRVGFNKVKKYRKYKRLTKEMIYELFQEKMELRKIARVLGVELRIVQYHLKKTYGV